MDEPSYERRVSWWNLWSAVMKRLGKYVGDAPVVMDKRWKTASILFPCINLSRLLPSFIKE